ncbi:hypothetical protein DRW03_25350 [Corallococcus sp. H22C18031201]|uniref:YsnF/AvaK domain-containing protein n=1 Tax=Citreicoccus inhibens TaxID=2849499 RepID=UPI000E733E09|nr:YsnF/AvaK domain-containing protein [Citreicoccus inhibens]MBU8898974.1 YsnF/AvaK domain-containing protein [Citreicoccus inhibens]RJS18450.1 hypothetical protein DRW03_25350 [Corallococcus sp. H22C18031201]
MIQRSDINEGMTVRSIDGEKLGKVFAIGELEFHVERGMFFPKDYLVQYSEVSDIRDGEVFLNHGKEMLSRLAGTDADGAVGRTTPPSSTTRTDIREDVTPSAAVAETQTAAIPIARGTERDTAKEAREGRAVEDISIPLHKERLDVTKRERQTGEVRVRKEVIEEEKVMDIPLRRERVRVERREVTSDRPAMGAAFQEETIVVPMRAEEVDVSKRAYVDEEVVIHKDAVEEERHIAERLRHEDVQIRTEDDTEGARAFKAPSEDPLKRS